MNFFAPPEVAQLLVDANVKRSKQSMLTMVLLGILAGAYIAFGAQGSTMAAHDVTKLGAGFQRFLTGATFSVGLMFVIVCGAELFTGNVLMGMAFLQKKVSLGALLRHWTVVLLANFVGAVMIAWFMYMTGLFKFNGNLLGVSALNIAVNKVNESFTEAFFRGILCNWLVGLAVWMATASKDVISKLLSCFIPVMTFVMSNFEHSIANFYYLPAGLFAKSIPAVVATANLGAKINTLTWTTALTHNWIPVLLGNIVGSFIFVAAFYWAVFVRPAEQTAAAIATKAA